MIRRTWLGVLLVTIGIPCDGREILVDTHGSGDHRSISQAVSHTRPGDVVTILPGIYREEVLLEGKQGKAPGTDCSYRCHYVCPAGFRQHRPGVDDRPQVGGMWACSCIRCAGFCATCGGRLS